MFTEVLDALVEFLYMVGSFILNVYFGLRTVFHIECQRLDPIFF